MTKKERKTIAARGVDALEWVDGLYKLVRQTKGLDFDQMDTVNDWYNDLAKYINNPTGTQ